MRVPAHVLTIVLMVPLHFSLTKPAAVLFPETPAASLG
jgi:hypothetical protein